MDGMGTPGEGLGRCSHALIRGVPESLASGEGAGAGLPALDLAKAQREHGVLGGKLRQRLGLQLLELPPEESLPLGPLLGDTAVIQGDTALITRPWSPARRPEVTPGGAGGHPRLQGRSGVGMSRARSSRPKVDGVRKALQDLGLRIVEMADENATLDGTDVLFTGEAGCPSPELGTGEQGLGDRAIVDLASNSSHPPPPPPLNLLASGAQAGSFSWASPSGPTTEEPRSWPTHSG